MSTSDNASTAERLARLPQDERAALLERLGDASTKALRWDWRFWGRANQHPPPGNWRVWLFMGGRGVGKTRSGAEWVKARVAAGARRIALVAPTASDARDVMVEGETGILAVYPEADRPTYEPSKRRIVWPNGAVATTFSADQPERLRGPQHDAAWADELGAWRYPGAFDMLLFGLRLGDDPRVVVTTTPRPTGLIRALVRDPNTVVTRGSSFENRANLAPAFFDQIVKKYAGTRLGRQELEAELLEDTPGALWSYEGIDAARWPLGRPLPPLVRIVVAIDPAATSGEYADDTGIVVVGKDADGHAYVLADVSGQMAPVEWASAAIAAYRTHRADRIVAERNNGGEMVAFTIRAVWPEAPVTEVWASRSKVTRAEPVSALYEQRRVHHCGTFPQLEDQMTGFTIDLDRKASGYSPDRVDALVWAITELLVEQPPQMWTPGLLKIVA
jgi:phage terminase large subunit-like protein